MKKKVARVHADTRHTDADGGVVDHEMRGHTIFTLAAQDSLCVGPEQVAGTD